MTILLSKIDWNLTTLLVLMEFSFKIDFENTESVFQSHSKLYQTKNVLTDLIEKLSQRNNSKANHSHRLKWFSITKFKVFFTIPSPSKLQEKLLKKRVSAILYGIEVNGSFIILWHPYIRNPSSVKVNLLVGLTPLTFITFYEFYDQKLACYT